MKRILKKVSAYILTGMILLESIFIHLQTQVYSVENGLAKRQEAINWLKNNQNSDGSWGTNIKIRDTSEILKLADEDWFTETEVIGDASEWINSQKAYNYDEIYRINSIKQTQQNINIAEVTELQNNDGGWSLNENYVSDTYDTLLALQACVNAEEIHTDTIKKGVAYLLLNQMESGAFTYSDNEENVYLTAYASYVLKEYTKSIGRNDEGAKIALSEAVDYLMECEDEKALWGTDENSMLGTIMSTIVLADNDRERTYNRIEIIAGNIYKDGSLYESPVLTAMFVNLVDTVLMSNADTTDRAEIEELYVYAMDGEKIKAYTDVCFEVEMSSFSEETMTLSIAVGTKELGYETIKLENGIFVWNTSNRDEGNYEVHAIITDKNTGEIFDIEKKIFKIYKSVDVTGTYLTTTPNAYKIESGDMLSFQASADISTNVDGKLKMNVEVKDHNGNKIYNDSVEENITKNDKYISTKKFGFIPDAKEKTIYYAELSVVYEDEIIGSFKTAIETYNETEEKAIVADYTADRQWILPEEDEVNVQFSLKGIGNIADVERMPMDIVICLDNSMSMDKTELEDEVEAAKMIVDYISPRDRASVIFVSPGTVASEFTANKEEVKSTIDGIYSKYGTYIEKAINTATEILKESEEGRKRVLFILSDGMPDNYKKTINNAKTAVENNITIHTLGIGSVAEELLIELADIGGGEYMLCQTTDDLMTVMERMAEELFSVAGTGISLSMKLEDEIGIEDLVFEAEPDEIIQGVDETVTIVWNKPYMSIGENEEIKIKVKTSETREGEMVGILSDIVLHYTNLAGEDMQVKLPDLSVRVKSQYVSGNITTEKDNYIVGEDVAITLEAIKEVDDKILTGVIEVADENGVKVEIIDDGIVVGDEIIQNFIWNTEGIVPGNYKVVVTWYRNEKVVDTQECLFDVKEETADTSTEGETKDNAEDSGYANDIEFVKIKGDISLSKKDVLTGELIDAFYDVRNFGTKYLENAELKINIINVETQEAEVLNEESYNIGAESTVTGNARIDTQEFAEGQYLVTLNAGYDEEQILLGVSGFNVTAPEYIINVIAEDGGTVNMEVSGSYKENSSIELVATPDKGYVFAGWISEEKGAFENEYSETTTFITPGNDTVITAMFVKQKYLLTTEAENGGRIVSEVAGSYEVGSDIELNAEAFSGYDFKCWRVNGEGTLKDEHSATTIFTTGDGDALVTALFVLKDEETTRIEDETKSTVIIENPTTNIIEQLTADSSKSKENINDSTVNEDATSKKFESLTENSTSETSTREDSEKKVVSDDVAGKATTNEGDRKSMWEVVKTGDFGERAIIIRNITIMLLIGVLVSLIVTRKEENE